MIFTKLTLICIVIVLGLRRFTLGNIPIYEISLENLLNMQLGLGWPHSLIVSKGHEALIKLTETPTNQQSCVVTTPTGLTFNVNSPPNNRFESWSDSCGLRIRNIEESDEGRWRLTATGATGSITGWSAIHVEEGIETYTPTPISLYDGETTHIELTTLDNSYCLVAQPFSESSLVPGHCSITLERASRAVQGNWNVLLGIPGRVSEINIQKQVSVQAERLDVGYIRDTSANKLHLYCNILHTHKNITFCRFQQTISSSGYNVIDGLSDGSHSYYGEGFVKRHCGMTIESPTDHDYGTWRCSVGVQEWVDNNIHMATPLQALINIPSSNTNNMRNVLMDGVGLKTIFVQEGAPVTIMCRADVSLQYCWFQHPNGSQFTPVPLVDEDQLYWYSGESFSTGDCGITFSHVSREESGEWVCHMGPSHQLGVEVTDRVYVRITGPLAANLQEVAAPIGGSVTLYCHTSNGNRPLQYCRFLSPTYVGFIIDSSITENNSILGRYYFTPERELDYGDCSLTISSVQHDDIGQWTCAALLDEENMESRDYIILRVAESANLSQAGIIGMSVGIVALVICLVGILLFKRYRKNINTNLSTARVVTYEAHRTSSSTNSSNVSEQGHITIH